MHQIETYGILLCIIIAVGLMFRKSRVPISLLLVMVGMLLSFIPRFPQIRLDPKLVIDIFLPLLVYQVSTFSSWRDYKAAIRPIALLSIGHVIIITGLIAVVVHAVIPELGWPIAFLIGAVVSPPDDVAIVAIAEKVRIPRKVITILKGEGMFNDATALILFRFSLAVVVIHEFSAIQAVSTFFMVVGGEILYGYIIGNLVGQLRMRVKDPILHMLISILTPFLAYLPAERLGGCGVLATVVTGLIIQHKYFERFAPEFRLLSHSVWTTLGFVVENIIFLLVGLEMRFIVDKISTIPSSNILLYMLTVITVVIVGRFICVFPFSYIPRFLFPSIRAHEPKPSWQYLFIISWSGMRGGVSLAAALAIPTLPSMAGITNPRDLIVFLVFGVIAATLLLQGLTLPWMLKRLGVQEGGEREKHDEYVSELSARISMVDAVLSWLSEYKGKIKDKPEELNGVNLQIQKYEAIQDQLQERFNNQSENSTYDEAQEIQAAIFLSTHIINVERQALLQLWAEEKIDYTVKTKLQEQLDHRYRGIAE